MQTTEVPPSAETFTFTGEPPRSEPEQHTPAAPQEAQEHESYFTTAEQQYEFFRTLIGRPAFMPWKDIIEKTKLDQVTDIVFNCGKLYMRIAGDLELAPEEFQLSPENCEKALISTIPYERHLLELMSEKGATDFGVTVEGMRMRGNIFKEMQGLNGVFRPIPEDVLPDNMLLLDERVIDIALKSKQGLVLVTGATGSGKSSTVVALLEKINQAHKYNVITIEDPIEYVFTPKGCVFSQREIGAHAESFDSALRSAMRQNPDVIFVGEIRDYPTMAAALKAAETGHLVYATLHTRRVYTTLNRLIQMAPAGERDAIRDALAQNILLIICQGLLKRKEGRGLIPCREVAIRNNALIACIMTGKVRDINNVMIGSRPLGMIDWNNALKILLQKELITEAEVVLYRDKETDV